MKELIRKFEKESGLEIYGLGARRDKWEHTMEKFAELVVKECAKQVDNYWDTFENGYADKKILEHFGVEE